MQFNDPCLMTSFSRPDAGDVPHTNHRNPTVVNFLPVTFFMEICRTVDYPDRLDELADLLTEGFLDNPLYLYVSAGFQAHAFSPSILDLFIHGTIRSLARTGTCGAEA